MMAQTAAEISAELTILYAARVSLAKGERVDEMMRDGRKMSFGKMSMKDLNELIQQRESDLAQAEAVEAGGTRRQAIGTYF